MPFSLTSYTPNLFTTNLRFSKLLYLLCECSNLILNLGEVRAGLVPVTVVLALPGYPVMDSILIACSKASLGLAIFCCIKGIRVRGSSPWINHSLCWVSWMRNVSLPMRSQNLCAYSHAVSPTVCLISFSSAMLCCSDLGCWNSVRNCCFTSGRVRATPLGGQSTNWIFHRKALPLRVVWNSISREASGIPLDLHIASQRNQCCSASYSPLPQNSGTS